MDESESEHEQQSAGGGSSLRRTGRRVPGQALVEFALVLPLLIVLIFAIMDFGYYLFVVISVNHATRAGVRRAAMNNVTCDQIKTTVVQSAVGVVINSSSVSVTPTAADATLPGSPPSVEVAVNYKHQMLAPSVLQIKEMNVKSTFKGIVTTYTGKETITFTCP
jgi:Flp pilus assembly protein TadG